ncbi:DNA-binding MarR family transcriptional regulator [Paenibacillus endophyticus]|uniref:DNA-binding MarR family transcriptional regulator n=1 Tax=Paenibacillus endophyticus TaxID=1294268 RepID=A0A7W5CCW1_9BACL|nr:MarR family transcriptional regulator [Paenibacillus endophyticus]MBB3155387.1 DNA-binding MarR family transcriptional regulator [Paenibacillus endophyticus]
MENKNDTLDAWLFLTDLYSGVNDKLERTLQEKNNLSLKEFYVLYFISKSDDKKLRLQQLQEMIGLSQSAISRLVVRMEAKNYGALERHVCEDDRRGIYTRITELGENKFQRALNTFNEVLQLDIQYDELKKLQHLIPKLS